MSDNMSNNLTQDSINLTQLYTSDQMAIVPVIPLKTVAGTPLFGTGDIDVESEKYTTWFVFFITGIDNIPVDAVVSAPSGGRKSLDVPANDEYPISKITNADGNDVSVSWCSEAEANAYAGKENYKIFYSYATLCHKPKDDNPNRYYTLQNGESWSRPIEYALGTVGKDGEGIEYMYYLSDKQLTNLEAPNDNWPYDVFVNSEDGSAEQEAAEKSGWRDDPRGVSFEYPYEYVSIRTGSGEPDDWRGRPWSKPSLWSKYGEDGRDGEGLEYIYFLSNSADAPEIDGSTNTEDPSYKGFSIDAQQTPEHLPTTSNIKWTDDYVKPSDSLRYSWVSTRRYKDTGVKDEKGKPIFKWTLFNTPKLWNVFMQSGKAYAELYRRSTAPLSIANAPKYTGDIYYWFDTDKYTSDLAGTEQLIEIGKEDNLWHDDYVEEGGSYLYMCEALVDIESIDKPVRISEDKWKNVKLISKDGESALTIFIDLSNDMDQIYVNDEFKTPCKQVFVTTPAVFDGIDHQPNVEILWSLKCINADDNKIVPIDDGSILSDKEFSYTIPENRQIDGDYIFTFTYNVSNDTTGGESGTNTTGSVSNTFKLKRIQGTHDYDLWSSVTYIKKDASNNYNCSDTSIYITSRSVNSKVGEITKLDTVPADCSVVYIDKDGDGEVKETITEGNILTKFKFEKTDYTKSVELYRGGVLVDVIYIDVIKDGEKGDPGESAMFIDLSNEMDQIYVSDTGQLPVKQTFSTVPRIFRGSKEQLTGTISYKITYDDDTSIDGLSDDKATGSIDTGETFSCEFDTSIKIVRNIKCVFTDVSSGASSTFSIKRLQGLTDYDLYSNCTVVVQDTNGNNTPNTIEVGITAKSILTPEKYAKRPTTLPSNCKIKYNGVECEPEEGNILSLPIKVPVPVNDDTTKYFELYNDEELIDQITIEVLKDGSQGAPGESAIHIDLSNDMDQVYVNEQYYPVVAQTFTTIPVVFKGTKPINSSVATDVSYIIKDANGTIAEGDTSIGEIFRYTIPTNNPINSDIYCVFTYSGASSTFVIKRIQGTHDYDLWSDVTYIKKANEGFSPNDASIKITSRPVNLNGGIVEYLTEVPTDCSVVYIDKDNNGIEITKEFPNKEDGNKLKNFAFKKNDYTKYVELYRNGELVDKIIIDILKDGKDGNSSYFIDLSNDVDQVYVNANGKTDVAQTFTTIPMVFNGTNPITDADVSCGIKNVNGKITYIRDISVGTEFKYDVGAGDTIADDIHIIFTYNNTTSSTFIIKRIQGTYDYDLWSDVTYVKMDALKNVKPNFATVKITGKAVNSKIGTIEYLDTVPANCSVVYKEGDVIKKEFPNKEDGNKLTKFEFEKTDITKSVELHRGGVLVDVIYIDVLKDGESPYFIDLSNDMDQLYIDSSGYPIVKQTFTCIPTVYYGSKIISDAELAVSLNYDHGNDNMISYVNTCKSGSSYELAFDVSDYVKDDITLTFTYDDKVSKTFIIKTLEGNHDYDLWSDVTYIRADASGKIISPKDASVKIVSKPVSIKNVVSNYLTKVPVNCSVNYGDDSSFTTYETGQSLPKFEFIDNAKSKYIELYRSGELVDKINIEIVKDGEPGADGSPGRPGDPGVSASFIDLSNDMDQIYVNADNYPIKAQTFSTTPRFFVGTTLDTSANINYVITYDNGDDISKPGFTTKGSITSSGEVKFTIDSSVKIEDNIKCVFTYKGVSSTFTIKMLHGNIDYDLYSNCSVIIEDKAGKFDPSYIDISIKSRNLQTLESTHLYCTEVPANCSIYYDGSTKNASAPLPWRIDVSDGSTKIIKLYRDNVLVDQMNIEVLKDGKDGESPYFIDLSNDMDQLYIDSSGYPIVKQTFTCTPTLYYGSKIESDAKLDVSLYYTPSNANIDHETTCKSGEPYELTFDTSNRVISDVHLTFTYDNKVSKTFIIKTLEGNHDYDLWSNVTYIRTDASCTTINPIDASVKIVSRPVNSKNGKIEYLREVPDYCSVVYIGALNSPTSFGAGDELPDFKFDTSTNTKYIELYRSGELVDRINIEVVKDGSKGDRGDTGAPGESASFIDLSNDMDQIYVNADNYPIKEQTFSTTPRFFVGKDLQVDSIDYVITYDTVTPINNDGISFSNVGFTTKGTIKSNTPLEFTIDSSVKIADNIKCVFTCKGVSSTFTIKMLHGNIDYDLYSNCSVIIKDTSSGYNPSAIDISIKSRNLQTLESTELYCTTVPAGYCIKYDDVTVKTAGDVLPYSITVKDDSTKTIKLYRGDVLVDQMNIEVLKDGEPGAPGESPYFIDLSNDMDQIYINANGYPIEDQTITCTPTLYHGIEKVKDASIYYRIGDNNNNLPSISNGTLWSKEFLTTEQITDDIHVTFVDTSIFENRTASKTFTIKRMIGDHDYDLWSNVTYIRTDASCTTINPTDASVKIVSKPVNLKNGKIEYLTEVPTDCSVKYIGANPNSSTSFDAGDELPDFKFDISTNTKYIELYRSGKLVDRINIEVVKDGSKGDRGDTGAPGVAGPIIYPAGVWNSEKTYKADADGKGNLTRIPYVEYDSSYYICISVTDTSTRPAENSTDWQPMAQFDSVFTKLLVAENGTIGKAVYSGDYMFSQHGKINGIDSSKYEMFNASNGINSILSSNEDFVPNMCLDFKSGAGYFNRGSIKFDAGGLVIGSDVSINANLTVGDFVVNDFEKEPTDNSPKDTNTKFVYANNGSWGYVDYGEDISIKSIRAICNSSTMKVSLKRYTREYDNYKVLEGRIIGNPYASVEFMDYSNTKAKLDGYGVLDYVAIAGDDTYGAYDDYEWTLKLLNQFASSDYAKNAYTIDVTVKNLPSYLGRIKYCNLELFNGNFPLPDPFGTTQPGVLNDTTCTWNFDKNKYTLLKPTVAYITFTTDADESYMITMQNDGTGRWEESVDAPQYNSNLNYNISNYKLSLYPSETDWEVM